ncbi:MAG TPA: hypothetical protein VJ900_01835 [Patescibacteria group bacterium]|nr:hypothetical protein [Patescibacteria group bacterium]
MSFLLGIFKNIFFDSMVSILYFPFWWYSTGLKKRFLGFIKGTKNQIHDLSLKIMFKYLFKPMYGETSFSGRIISFFMRLILLIWRIFLFLVFTLFRLTLLILWVAILPIVVWQLIIRFLI